MLIHQVKDHSLLDVESSVTGRDIVLEQQRERREAGINGRCQELQQVGSDLIFIGLGASLYLSQK